MRCEVWAKASRLLWLVSQSAHWWAASRNSQVPDGRRAKRVVKGRAGTRPSAMGCSSSFGSRCNDRQKSVGGADASGGGPLADVGVIRRRGLSSPKVQVVWSGFLDERAAWLGCRAEHCHNGRLCRPYAPFRGDAGQLKNQARYLSRIRVPVSLVPCPRCAGISSRRARGWRPIGTFCVISAEREPSASSDLGAGDAACPGSFITSVAIIDGSGSCSPERV